MIKTGSEPNQTAETIGKIRSRGIKAGVAIKPGTPAEAIFPYLTSIDMALVMTVEPGYGGQSFIPSTLEKVSAIKEKCAELGVSPYIQVDGGINGETAEGAAAAGANVLVSGTYLIRAESPADAVKSLKLKQ